MEREAATAAPAPIARAGFGDAPPRPAGVERPEDDLGLRLIQPGDKGIYLGDVKFADEDEQRIALLFALLQEATSREKAASSRLRRYHNAKALADLDEGLDVTEQAIYQWVMRARKAIDQTGKARGKDVIEGRGRKGIRLGPQFGCHGFDVQGELARYKASRREA